jgi:hypothetical protein
MCRGCFLQIFGPVLSVGRFKTEEEAVALANDTNYGLGAGLHSSTFTSMFIVVVPPSFPLELLILIISFPLSCR